MGRQERFAFAPVGFAMHLALEQIDLNLKIRSSLEYVMRRIKLWAVFNLDRCAPFGLAIIQSPKTR
jgi:hypothetical protein